MMPVYSDEAEPVCDVIRPSVIVVFEIPGPVAWLLLLPPEVVVAVLPPPEVVVAVLEDLLLELQAERTSVATPAMTTAFRQETFIW
jgi:hypothetical protein